MCAIRLIAMLAILATPVLFGSSGCSSNMRPFRHFGDKTVNDPTLEFDARGPIGLDIELFAGDVNVLVDEKLTATRVTLTRRATHGWGRGSEAKGSLDEIQTSAEMVPGTLGQVLQVRASTLHPEPYYQGVDVDIRTPDVDGVRIHTSAGNVIARGVAGKVDIATRDGDVRVLTERPLTDSVRIINDYGNVDFRIRGESTGELDVQAFRGTVRQKVDHGQFRVYTGTDQSTLKGSLNNGTNPMVLRAADGDVRLAVVSNPEAVGAFILD